MDPELSSINRMSSPSCSASSVCVRQASSSPVTSPSGSSSVSKPASGGCSATLGGDAATPGGDAAAPGAGIANSGDEGWLGDEPRLLPSPVSDEQATVAARHPNPNIARMRDSHGPMRALAQGL